MQTRSMTKALSLQYLKKVGVMYGSRALGVETKDSDYDFAVFEDDLKNFHLPEATETGYRGVLSPPGKKIKIHLKCDLSDSDIPADIMVLKEQKDLLAMCVIMFSLRVWANTNPEKACIKDKRVKAFITIQKQNGWITHQ